MIKKIVIVFCLIVTHGLMAQCDLQKIQLHAGGNHTIVLDHEGYLWSSGDNRYGQLGLGMGDGEERKNKLHRIGNQKWNQVAAGETFTVAIRDDGTLWSWGNNQFGQLGDGSTTDRYEPVQVGTETTWAKVSAGKDHTIALKKNGTLWSWGKNEKGLLGLSGNRDNEPIPTQVETNASWNLISAGSFHNLAIKKDGAIWSWGQNLYGELGVGSYGPNFSFYDGPKPIEGPNRWKQVCAGIKGSLGIDIDGNLWAWGQHGSNEVKDGQLGFGYKESTKIYVYPTRLDRGKWKKISFGEYYGIALKADGTLWAFGANDFGQLGNGNNRKCLSFTQIGTGNKWRDISAGKNHAVALSENGELYSWGRNQFGQLMDGSFTGRKEITKITEGCKLNVTGFTAEKISIYPNPVNSNITIDYGDLLFGEAKITLYNSLGQVVLQKNSTQNEALPLEGAPGCYFISIDFGDGKILKRKIIKK